MDTTLAVGDEVAVVLRDGSRLYTGKLVGLGPIDAHANAAAGASGNGPTRAFDIERHDGSIGAGVAQSWRVYTSDLTFGYSVVKLYPAVLKAGGDSVDDVPEWRRWRTERPGECACGISRKVCRYHPE